MEAETALPAPVDAVVSPLFGLFATGRSWLYKGHRSFPSERLYRTREAAKADIPEFIERVCNPTDFDLDCLRREDLNVEIFEYTLMD